MSSSHRNPFDEIRALFKKARGIEELPHRSHLSQDSMQQVWFAQLEGQPLNNANRITLISSDGVRFFVHHDVVCSVSSVVNDAHLRDQAVICDQFSSEVVRALLKYVYLRCVDREFFAANVSQLIALAASMQMLDAQHACGTEWNRQLRSREMSVDELVQVAYDCSVVADLPATRQTVSQKLAVRWTEVLANKEAWRRLKLISRTQEDRSTDEDVMTIMDDIMALLPKPKTYFGHLVRHAKQPTTRRSRSMENLLEEETAEDDDKAANESEADDGNGEQQESGTKTIDQNDLNASGPGTEDTTGVSGKHED